MRWSWPLDAWRILINPIRSWSPRSRKILNFLIFKNKSSLNKNWIIYILFLKKETRNRLKRKLLHLDLLLLLKTIVFSNSVGFYWIIIFYWKTRQNPNTMATSLSSPHIFYQSSLFLDGWKGRLIWLEKTFSEKGLIWMGGVFAWLIGKGCV